MFNNKSRVNAEFTIDLIRQIAKEGTQEFFDTMKEYFYKTQADIEKMEEQMESVKSSGEEYEKLKAVLKKQIEKMESIDDGKARIDAMQKELAELKGSFETTKKHLNEQVIPAVNELSENIEAIKFNSPTTIQHDEMS